MSIESHVLALIEEGNPVPDPDQITDLPVEPAAYLATLDQRSSEVTQLDTRVEKPDSRRKAGLWTAAAALVVIAGLIAFLTSGNESPVATDPPPTTITDTNAANLSGSWAHIHVGRHADSEGIVSAVFENDTYAFMVNDVLVDHGSYTTDLSSGQIEFVSADDSAGCEPGAEGVADFEATEETLVLLSGLDESCFARGFFLDSASDVFSFGRAQSMMVPTDPIDIDALTTELDIDGYWGTDSKGVVFVDGRYTLINGGTVDTGTYENTTGPFQIALTSDDQESRCANVFYNFALVDGEDLFAAGRGLCNGLGDLTFPAGLPPSEPFEIPGPFTEPVPELAGAWSSRAVVENSEDGEQVSVWFWNDTYVIVDRGEEFDRGTYTIDDNLGLLTITSGQDSNECDEGATYSSAYEIEEGNSLTLSGDVDDCPARLNLLSNAGPLTLRIVAELTS